QNGGLLLLTERIIFSLEISPCAWEERPWRIPKQRAAKHLYLCSLCSIQADRGSETAPIRTSHASPSVATQPTHALTFLVLFVLRQQAHDSNSTIFLRDTMVI